MRANDAVLYPAESRPTINMPPSSEGENPSSPSSNQKGQPPRSGGLRIGSCCKVKRGLGERIQQCFGRYAELVYDYPWMFIGASVLVTIIFGIGLLFSVPEKNAEALYSLPYSRAKTDRDLLVQTFGAPGRVSALFIMSNVVDPETEQRVGLMTPALLERLAEFDQEIREDLAVENSTTGEVVSYSDICYRDAWGDCQSMSVLNMYQQKVQWGRPVSTYDYPMVVNRRTQKVYKSDLLLAHPTVESRPFSRGRTRTMIYNATGFVLVYYGRDDEDYREASMVWEAALIDRVLNTKIEGVDISVNAQRSWEDELVASTALKARDLFDYTCAFLLISAYAAVVNFSRNLYRTKALSAVMGATAALMGFAAGGGLCYYGGLTHAPTMNATPFLVLGIGLDDMFVILNSYSLTFLQASSKDRARVTLMDAGIAISVTTATNLLGFSIGAISPYLAVRNFCIISVAGLLGGYIMALTFFFAVLTLEARREENESYFLPLPKHPLHLCKKRKDVHIKNEKEATNNIGALLETRPTATGDCSEPATATEHNSAESQWNTSAMTATVPIHVARDLSSYELVSRQVRHYEYKYEARKKREQVQLVTRPSKSRISSSATERQGSPAKRRNVTAVAKQDSGNDETSENTGSPSATGTDSGPPTESDNLEALPGSIERPVGSFKIDRSFRSGKKKKPLPQRRRASMETDRLSYTEPIGNPGKCYRWLFLRIGFLGVRRLWVKLIVVAVFLGYLGVSVWQTTHLKPGLPFHDLTPSDSYLREAYDVSIKNFDIFMLESFVFFPTKTPWWEEEYQAKLQTFNKVILEADYTNDVINGMQMFLDSDYGLESFQTNETLFHQNLREWLDTPIGKNVRDSFLLNEDGELEAWKMRIFNPFFADTFAQSRYMINVRDDCDQFKDTFDVRPYQEIFVFFESDVTIFQTTFISVGAAFLAISFVSMAGLKGKRSVVLVMAMIIMVNIGLFGFMDLLGLKLNILTQIYLILSIGFSVDYTVHIVHTFTECLGRTRNHRMVETLVLMGTPVTHGAISTWLAMIPLMFRKEYVLELFYRMISLVLLFGLTHGVILLPVILSWTGKMTDKDIEDDPIIEGQKVAEEHTGQKVAEEPIGPVASKAVVAHASLQQSP